MRSVLVSAVRPAVAGALLCALAACEADSPRPPVVVVTPEPIRVVYLTSAFSGFETDMWVPIPIPLSQRGKLDISVDWTASDTWMYVYLGTQVCDYAQLSTKQCPFLIASETKDPKPRLLLTGNLEVGQYYLYLYNVPRDPRAGIGSDNTEAVSIQVGLTVGAEDARAPGAVQMGSPTVVGTKDPKPRVLLTQNLDPGTYYLVLYNVPRDPRTGTGSDNTEAVAIQVGLTVGAEDARATGAVQLGNPRVVATKHP